MKTSRHKVWLTVLAIISSIVLLLLLALPKLLSLNRYRDTLQNLAAEHLGVQLQLGPMRWGISPNNSIWLEAETVTMAGAFLPAASLSAGKVTIKFAVSPLLQRKLVIKDILLQSPVLKLQLRDQAEPKAVETAKDDSATTAPTFSLELTSLRIENGELIFSDKRSDEQLPELHFSDITATIMQPEPGAKTELTLALQQMSPKLEAWGRLTAQGSLAGLTPAFSLENPSLDVQSRIEGFAAEALRPWLNGELANGELAARLSGTLDATLNYRGWPGGTGNMDGQLDFGQFSYHDPALWQNPVPGSPATLQFNAQLQADEVQFDRLAFAINDIKANARLTLSNLKKQAVMNGSLSRADIPLKSAIPLMPWTALGELQSQLQDVMKGGGTLQLTDIQLPEVELTNQDIDQKTLLNAITGSLQLSGLSARPMAALPRLENINGHLSLAKGILTGKDITARFGPLSLPVFSLTAHQLLDLPKLAVQASGPMALAANSTQEIQQLLMPYNLSRLSVDAQVDVDLDYDRAKPDEWLANGSVQLDDVQLTTLRNNQLKLQGRVKLKRDRDLKLLLDGIKGSLNHSPVSVDGAVLYPGRDAMAMNLQVKASKLDLAQLVDVVPALKALALKGTLDTDMSVVYDAARPHKTRLKGTFAGNKLELQAGNFKIDQAETHLLLAGKQVAIKKLSLRLNRQPMEISGSLKLDPHLQGKLSVSSTELNLDDLLATQPAGTAVSPPEAAPDANQAPVELPGLIRDAKLAVNADVAKGVYRGVSFRALKLYVDYHRAVAQDHQLSLSTAGGTVTTNGRIELKDLSRIKFDTKYKISNIRIEELLPAIVGHATNARGPFSNDGHIRGTTGSGLLESLRGDMVVSAGPGRIASVGPLTKALFHVLEVINLEEIIKGSMADGLAQKGISFESLALVVKLDPQGAHITNSSLLTPAFNTQGTGLVSIVEQSLDMELELAVLGTLDKVVGLVPLVGSAASNITKVFLVVEGPLEKPRVIVRPAQGVIKTVEGGITDPVKELGKGLDALRGILHGKDKKRD